MLAVNKGAKKKLFVFHEGLGGGDRGMGRRRGI